MSIQSKFINYIFQSNILHTIILHTSSPDVDITIFSVGFPDFVPNFWNGIKNKSLQLHTTKTN